MEPVQLDFKWFLGIIGLSIAFIAGKLTDRWFDKEKTEEDEIVKLTIAIQALQIEIKYLTERLAPIPRMQDDINALHGKVREIVAKVIQ